MFYQCVLPEFNHFNLFLQREDPCIHLVNYHCHSLLKKILGKFVRAEVIKASTSLSEVDLAVGNQLPEDDIFVEFVTRQKLKALVNEGDVSSRLSSKFLQGVRSFYEAAVGAKFLLKDDILLHARVKNFEKCENRKFSSVEYFLECYSSVLAFSDSEKKDAFDEIVDYQLSVEENIPQSVWESAKESLEDNLERKQVFIQMNVIWAFLSLMMTSDHCSLRFPNLSRVARLILVLPHSNAGEEQVFI